MLQAEILKLFDLVIFSFIMRSRSAWGLVSAWLIRPVLELLSRLLSVCCTKQCMINEPALFSRLFFKFLSTLNRNIQRGMFALKLICHPFPIRASGGIS